MQKFFKQREIRHNRHNPLVHSEAFHSFIQLLLIAAFHDRIPFLLPSFSIHVLAPADNYFAFLRAVAVNKCGRIHRFSLFSVGYGPADKKPALRSLLSTGCEEKRFSFQLLPVYYLLLWPSAWLFNTYKYKKPQRGMALCSLSVSADCLKIPACFHLKAFPYFPKARPQNAGSGFSSLRSSYMLIHITSISLQRQYITGAFVQNVYRPWLKLQLPILY